MALYLFYQDKEKTAWQVSLASERDSLTPRPALVTVLDVDNDFSRDLTLEETQAVKFKGPLYADFDSESIEECIPQFQAFLNKLREKGVDLNQVRLYATGGRGFHVEVPMGCFIPKPPPAGVVGLPHIYREMAHALYVDLLDLRVYSAKKGRMWRCPNVKRDNGHYKVGITVEEALSLTVADYDRLTSAPRSPLPIEPPTFSPNLALLYSQAKDKVDAGFKKTRSRKAGHESARQFKGEWPDTVKALLEGRVLKAGVGWNRVCMQLAIAADALGKSEEALIADSQALLEDYRGDSARYGTVSKRKAELIAQYRYMRGNPCYEFNVGGLIALVDPEKHDCADLRQGDYVPEVNEGEDPDEGEDSDDEDSCAISGKLKIDKSGIFVRGDQGYKRLSRVGIEDPIRLQSDTGEVIGYEVTAYMDGAPQQSKPLMISTFESRARFQQWTLQFSASCAGTDIQISAIADWLSRRTSRSKKVMMLVQREGVDLIVPIGAKSEDDYDIIWSSPYGVQSLKGNAYRFRGEADPTGAFKSDLHLAPELANDAETREFLDHLFQINTPHNLARILGWFSSVFLCQILRKIWGQYPMLQVYGQAGAGKSETTLLMNHMFYHLHTPQKLQAVGQTNWPIIAAVTQSASIPVIFEEVKGREMDKRTKDFLKNIMRNNYDGSKIQRGALSKDAGPREIVVNGYQNSGPIAFLGEGLENQAAILDRCVVVALSKQARVGRTAHFNYCKDRPTIMGRLGRSLMGAAVAVNYGELRRRLQSKKDAVYAALGQGLAEDNSRPCYNLAVVLVGLDFLRSTLHGVFGDRYDQELDSLMEVCLAKAVDALPDNKSEVARVLHVMGELTRELDVQYKLEKNIHYTTNGVTVDLKVRPAFAQYVRYTRSLGQEVLFDSVDAFISALDNYAGTVENACPDNPILYRNAMEAIFRLSCEVMAKELVEPFEM